MIESAKSIAARVRAGEVSPVELVETALASIERHNGELNAFVSLREEEALAEAREMADQIASGGDPGPLAGLPLGVKDLSDVAGMVTTFGSRIHEDDSPAETDCEEVAALRGAGAIVLGKTNTPDFAWSGYTNPPLFGPCRNPWNTERTPGGSSGGSASAIAAGMVPIATASDGGGSIRIPANFSGLFGLKPNLGRLGNPNSGGWQFFSVSGPLTRTVEDAALLLDLTAGPVAGDPFVLPPPGVKYSEVIEGEPWKGRVLSCPTLGWGILDPETERQVTSAIDRLGEIGADVEEIEKVFDDPSQWWITLAAADGAYSQGSDLDEHADLYDPQLFMQLQLGRSVTRDSYQQALEKRYDFCAALDTLLGEDTLLVAAVTAVPAYAAEGPHPTEIAGQPVPPTGFTKTYPFNFTGNPAVSIPCGTTSDGLPVGLQVVAPRFREDLLLRFSRAFEQAWPWELSPMAAP